MPTQGRHRRPWRHIVKIWTFIEAHHRTLGVALFVVPPLLGAMLICGIGYLASLIFG